MKWWKPAMECGDWQKGYNSLVILSKVERAAREPQEMQIEYKLARVPHIARRNDVLFVANQSF